MTLAAFIALLTQLGPIAIPAIEALLQKMQGMTPEQIAVMTKSINDKTIEEIDAELAKLPAATTTVTTTTTVVKP